VTLAVALGDVQEKEVKHAVVPFPDGGFQLCARLCVPELRSCVHVN